MNIFQIAFVIGVFIFLGWIAAYILCWGAQRTWAWIDDSKVGEHNKMIELLARLWGYKRAGGCYSYEHKTTYKRSDGDGPFFITGVSVALVPLLVVCAFTFYPVTIGVLTSLALAFLTRMARRHKKLFDKHVTDKDAHQQGDA